MTDSQYKNEIVKYYQESDWGYKYFWYWNQSWGLHHGLADASTKSHTEAIMNQYRLLVREAGISAGMRVLDAGCGVGGASVHIAKMTGARVYGITLDPNQVRAAQKHAITLGVENLTDFQVMDYAATSFPDEYFDVVFGIESIGYASPKRDFLREAYRITKHGGKLVVVDGYLTRKPSNALEKKLLDNTCRGWHMRDPIAVNEMEKQMAANGWKLIKVTEKTRAIAMSLRRMRVFCWLAKIFPINQGIRDNALALSGWIPGVDRGLFGYYVHVAEKK